MMSLINSYQNSRRMAKERIKELTAQRNELERKGRGDMIKELDLDRRIRLLYDEAEQMQEIILHLTSYLLWIGNKG